jgi:hypothetical protein
MDTQPIRSAPLSSSSSSSKDPQALTRRGLLRRGAAFGAALFIGLQQRWRGWRSRDGWLLREDDV